MFCRNCGTRLEDEAAFCHNCGTPVEEMDVVSADEPEKEESAIVNEPEEEVPESVDELVEEESAEIENGEIPSESGRKRPEQKKKGNRQFPIILAVLAVVLILLVILVPKLKKDDTKKADTSTGKQAEEAVDWRQAYLDFFKQNEQDILSCKLIEIETMEYPLLVYEADEGSLKYELLYVTKDGKAESVICYGNTTEVYYSQDGSVFANMSTGLYEKSFYTWKYDNSTDQFAEVKKGVAALDEDYYNETYSLRYDCTINDEACEESEYELYVREITDDDDYEYIELGQDDEQSIEELLKSDEKDSDEEEDVELDTDWNQLEFFIEEAVLPAYKTYISEKYGTGEGDVYSLLYVDDDKIPEVLFDKSGNGSGTVLLSYDNETGSVFESDASCRGYNFMYEPQQNYVVFCYAGNGLESYTVAHMENRELVVDQTFYCIWKGDITELKINDKECSDEEYNETLENALDKRVLAEGWNTFATIEEAYEELGHLKVSAFCDEITKFEMKGEQLTIQINNV